MKAQLQSMVEDAVIQSETEPSFQYAMAMMIRPGDLPKATELLTTAAEAGHLDALFELGQAYNMGIVPGKKVDLVDRLMGDDNEEGANRWKLT